LKVLGKSRNPIDTPIQACLAALQSTFNPDLSDGLSASSSSSSSSSSVVCPKCTPRGDEDCPADNPGSVAMAKRFDGSWHRTPVAVKRNRPNSERNVLWEDKVLMPQGGTTRGFRPHKALVFHTGTVYFLRVGVSSDATGKSIHYDGSPDALINANNTWMFTYEMLNDFITQLSTSQTDFHGYLRNSLRSYVWSTSACEDATLKLELLRILLRLETRTGSKRLYKSFVSSVFDFISLQKIPYAKVMRCSCVFNEDEPTKIVYDNACNTLVMDCVVRWDHPFLAGIMCCLV
jgi:hypothetical protein